MIRTSFLFLFGWCCLLSPLAFAHDTWVETNSNLVRTGGAVYIDLKLGNHGNDHRDFKLASKLDLEGCSVDLVSPDGTRYDLLDRLIDTGYAPNEGYWTSKFVVKKPGLYTVEHTLDKLLNHGHPIRAIKSAKTFFVVTPSLDQVSVDNPGFDRVAGHALELVPMSNPVTPMGPGKKLRMQVLFEGKPLADAKVSYIPQGVSLAEGFDEQYERNTDADGAVSFTPKSGNRFLIAVHHKVPAVDGEAYDETLYAATLTVLVPEICPCCGE
ncbi:DUF4198 domain-containing protein [Polystyrenella longa]|nr:DUF4198 domain-containing protein [Polystyrenella longa]